MKDRISIGTRGSQLALWQTHWVKSEIQRSFPQLKIDIAVIKTTGDRIVDRPLAMVGGKGLFVKEIETALFNTEIDLAVHSMKDMPGDLPEGLEIGAVPVRENPFDVLISRDNTVLEKLVSGSKIGTSSLRRASQIKIIRPDLVTESIRGNLDTRLNKLSTGEYDAVLLAAAGLNRLGMADRISQCFDETIMVPACGQGALCIETRENDNALAPILESLDHQETRITVSGERAFLKKLEGSCHIPVACFGKIENSRLILTGLVASENGREVVKETLTGDTSQAEKAGIQLAQRLLDKGARQILENLDI
ncbi:MAG: hydroxymethylbilane synthase [Thermodesulfobacteriota bacterium]|nr:hydroxymethylbilane synthase [Thermodesulfobacteriota bacterium]